MRYLVSDGRQSVDLIEEEMPTRNSGDVLVRIEASGICGSELHAPAGINLGHEAAGIVEEAPKGSGLEPGTRVGISVVIGCTTCDSCSRGQQIFCADVAVLHRLHADYASVPLHAIRRLPHGISAVDAVLLTGDVAGVPWRALRKVPPAEGERVIVIGLGPVGLSHVLVRSHLGADIAGIEPSAYRRDLARALGASLAVAPGQSLGEAPDVVIESTGVPACIQQAFDLVRPGGTVLQSGWATNLEFDPSAIILTKEISYLGNWYYADEDYPSMVAAYEAGLPLGKIVSHVFPADRAVDAYRQFVSTESGKVVLDWT